MPGLEAKPIVDILVGVEDLEARGSASSRSPRSNTSTPSARDEMHWFCKPHRGRRTHHLHLVPAGSRRYVEELAFRDPARRAELAGPYAALKRELAALPERPRRLHDAKAGFIREASPSC